MLQPSARRLVHFSILFALAWVAVACASAPAAQPPGAAATISALATANAQLATQVAQLAAAVATPAPTVVTTRTEITAVGAPPADTAATAPTEITASATPGAQTPGGTLAPPAEAAAPAPVSTPVAAATVNTPAGGPLPFLLAEIPLAPEENTIFDMRLDRATNHIYVTDTSGQLHVLDATSYAVLETLPLGGWLELDARNGRLYVYKPYAVEGDPGTIHVLDTTTLQEIGQIPGRALSVDSEHNRLFVGDPYLSSTPPDAPGVRIVDGATLQQTSTFTQTGIPVYNPLRDEVLIVAYTVYTADPKSGQITGDLFPELTDPGEGGLFWCNGCPWADDAKFFAGSGLIGVWVDAHCAGKGCGVQRPPTFYDAATMQLVDPAQAPLVQETCGSQASLLDSVQDRRYRNQIFDRYVIYTNFRVLDLAGNQLTWRDGLRTDFINPNTNQGYLYDGTVIDMQTLTPIGAWPSSCPFVYDPEAKQLFGRRGQSLYVIAEQGGEPPTPAPPAPASLEGTSINGLDISPNYATDKTLLATTSDGKIFRSTDAGATWMRLDGGLPPGDNQTIQVYFSPDYANDRTLYLTGYRGEYWGDGVWRSTDGGDSWEALWNNLIHRRGSELFFSPDFATDPTLVLQAEFYDLSDGISGESYQQSTDGGLSWTLVVTGNYALNGVEVPLPPVSELLPAIGEQPQLSSRIGNGDQTLEFTLDGSSWQTATTKLDNDFFYALLPSPNYVSDRTLYAFSSLGIWRSTDGGATWGTWQDPRLANMDYKNDMNAAAISPLLADGSYRLFAGTAGGQVWVLDPAAMSWTAAAGIPTPPAGATPQPAPAGTGTPAADAAALPAAAPSGAAETPDGEPPAGLYRPEGSFAAMWENTARLKQDLGWAKTPGPETISAAVQPFERGTMIWRDDTGNIFVIYNGGTWRSFIDTFQEGQPESDRKFAPPPGKMQPVRGFGKVWREHSDVRELLGWALLKEEGVNAQVQQFERGTLIRIRGTVYALIGVDTDHGTWY